MGLKTTTSAAKWIGLSKGKFVTGKDATKQEFPAFEGLLIGIVFRDGEFEGKKVRQFVLTFLDQEIYKVSINVSSGYGKQTLMKLPNCDISKPMELNPTHEGVGAAQRSGMFISQGGDSIKQKWTKDNPGQLPPQKQVEVRGEMVWDDTAQVRWLEEFTMSVIAPKCHENVNAGTPIATEDVAEETHPSGIPEDLPKKVDGEVPF